MEKKKVVELTKTITEILMDKTTFRHVVVTFYECLTNPGEFMCMVHPVAEQTTSKIDSTYILRKNGKWFVSKYNKNTGYYTYVLGVLNA